jgi:hypothetical protein
VAAVTLTDVIGPALAQARDPMGPPQPPPPPMPSPSDRASEDEDDDWKGGETREPERRTGLLDDGFLPDFEGEWGLDEELLAELASMSAVYEDQATGFTAIETARTARYQDGEAGKEDVRRYAYILRTMEGSVNVDEIRNVIRRNGRLGDEVVDAEQFPAAYTWIFLFHETNQPYFSYRLLGDRFEGFDWVREIQFRGALPFSDGQDIRQWEGVILVDAVSNMPLEIRSQPSAQADRLRQMFQNWSKSFNLAGFRTGPRPFGYRCEVEFRERRAGLSFPSRLRYDTYRAVSPNRTVRWSASSRFYTDYRLFGVETEERVAEAESAGGR